MSTLHNSVNEGFLNSADGFSLTGGTVKRTLTLNSGNLTLTSNGTFALTINANSAISGTNTGDQTITLSGDVTSGAMTNGTFTTTLANSGVTAGTYQGIVVNAKGIITSASNQNYGTGTVTSVSLAGANGIGISGSPITTSGTISLTLGAITPSSVSATGAVGGTALNSSGTINATGNITGANLSGTNTGDQTITLSGDVTSGAMTNGTFTTTLATVNASPGTFGNTTNIPQLVVNAKGLVTSVSNVAVTFGTGSVTSIVSGTGLSAGTITNTGTISVATNGISNALFRQSVATSLVGNAAATTGNVSDIAIGTGLTLPITGTLSLATSGVTAGTYAFSTTVVDALGRVTSATAGTPVTSVATGTGLSGGPITSTGTISMASSGVTAGTYTSATITVDALGRVTSATTGTGFTTGGLTFHPGINGTNYYDSPWVSGGALAGQSYNNNIMYAYPTVFPSGQVVDRIGVNVTTAKNNSNVRIGIYANNNGTPGSLILDSGNLASNTTGAKEATISYTFTGAMVWVTVLMDVTGVGLSSYNNDSTGPQMSYWMGRSTVTAAAPTCGTTTQTAGTLPATFPAGLTLTNAVNAPYIWFRNI